ncbi:response regulator [Sphingobacteriaceae bacterium]|nr:response regulator [Sphingobacteriaceae bacterium]
MFGHKNKSKLIFVVEDNTLYAKSLEVFLKTKFENIEVKLFPVGELALDNLHMKPDYIVVDYFLNGQYDDAEDGFSILIDIKTKDPKAKVILLSAQQDIKIALAVKDSGSMYVVKDDDAFENIAALIK